MDPKHQNGMFPDVDDHLVQPETGEEMLRGELIGGRPGPAGFHTRLNQLLGLHAAPSHYVSTKLLTRPRPTEGFGTASCVRKLGIDPETGVRPLEEVVFEVVREQSLEFVTTLAEDASTQGVRRLIAIFVESGTVAEWSQEERRFLTLPPDGMLDDPTLAAPFQIRALFDTAVGQRAVAEALRRRRTDD